MSGERVNYAIPSFINGVSQQPSSTRLASQCEEQINGYSSVVDGLRKRPPIRHMARLFAEQANDACVHVINRDANERYAVVITNGDLRVFDLLRGGVEVPVAFPDGKDYLIAARPRREIAMVTIVDHTIIVNKGVRTAMRSDRTPPETHEALAYIKRGYVSTTYKVMVGASWITYTTPDPYSVVSADRNTTTNVGTQPKTDEIAAHLAAGVNQVEGFKAEIMGSCLRITRNDGQDFAFKVTDSWGEEALVGIKRETRKFVDLPAKCWDGVKVRIIGENVGKEDDYYVEYNSANATKNGIWEETRGWDQGYAFDAATMPHLLVREADGTFSFRRADWDEAGVGDEYSVGDPSFVGCAIADVFFYRNRLGFVADENVILSRHGEYFDFWPQTATTVLATDPVDVATNGSSNPDKVSIIRHALPFKEALMLFSDQTQFQLSDGGAAVLSPETVRVDPSTEYEASRWCKPVAAGRSVFFVVERGDNSTVREYLVLDDSTGDDAEDIAAHVSRYIPKSVHRMIASSNENVVLLLSEERQNEIWVYKYFWIGEDKAQSSWSRWVLPKSDRILSIANVEAEIYLIVQRKDGVYLDAVNLQSTAPDSGLDFQIHLDRRVTVKGVYDEPTDTTAWTLPYSDVEPLTVVLGGGFRGKGGRPVPNTVQQGDVVTATGDYSRSACVIGRRYEFRYVFSEQHMRESREPAAPVIKRGRLQLRDFTVLHHDSGYFKSVVAAKGRDPVVKEHLGRIGDLSFLVGKPVIDSEPHRFGVLSKSDQVVIELVNDQHFPSNFTSAEWTGTFTADVRRI